MSSPPPPPPGLKPSIPSRPGFFIYEKHDPNSTKGGPVRHYITDWECCKCNTITRIIDQNAKWKARPNGPDPFKRGMALRTQEPCPHEECSHKRCNLCWDLDALMCRRRYCGGESCKEKFANQGPVNREWRPYEDLGRVLT